jgi:ABC-type phosphate/phosphonate transport system permease subunit
MKPAILRNLSTIVLWICTIISLAVFGILIWAVFTGANLMESTTLEIWLDWLYILLTVSIVVTIALSLFQFIRQWKDQPKSILQPLIEILSLGAILAGSYWLGKGNPLDISGYDGKENTWYWLKLTDMCLYTIYILLIATLVAVFVGIIGSYLKKNR